VNRCELSMKAAANRRVLSFLAYSCGRPPVQIRVRILRYKRTTMNRTPLAAIIASFLLLSSIAMAQVPQIINYQGRVSVNGTNFDGMGQFQFSLVDGSGGSTYWSNGNGVVSLPVAGGFYSVLLGDTNVTNMAAIPPAVFTNSDVRLRVWFNAGPGLQELTPDRRLTAVGYALMAGNVSDGVITSNKIAAGAVTTAAIADSAVGTSQIANYAITSLNIASNTITAVNMALGAGVVPSGTLVLSQTGTNEALTAAGFVPLTTITNIGSGAGTNWIQATSSALWSTRQEHAALVYNGKMWVLGGGIWPSGPFNNDVWSSSDGTNWTQATAAAPWSKRKGLSAVVLNDRMWVLGGLTGVGTRTNDVWSSTNGVDWTQATAAAPWSGREDSAAVVLDNQMWVLGGNDGSTPARNDVWSSSDGTNWTQATAAAPWGGRWLHAVVAYNGQMWVLGGNNQGTSNYNDVWSSSNGTNWTQVTPAAQWSARGGLAAIVVNGQIWVLGGVDDTGLRNDVWSSSDGTNWMQVTPAAQWTKRQDFPAVVLNSQMCVFGGWDGGVRNDVWSSNMSTSTSTSSVMLGRFYLFQKQ